MKTPRKGRAWYFVDEAGDPNFYGKNNKLIVGEQGCSKVFIMGFVETANPLPMRQRLLELQDYVKREPYFQKEPFASRTARAFHAKDDLPEVRYLVFDLIRTLDVRAEIVVARKIEENFIRYDNRRPQSFYDHLVSCLFERTLRRHEENLLYFSSRGSRARHRPLTDAICKGIAINQQWQPVQRVTTWTVQAQSPLGEPCLSVVDYILWAIYKAYADREMRFFNTIAHKVSLVGDIYDTAATHRWYDRKREFDITKTTPL